MNQIGSYILSRRIGAGGMAEVWMGHRATLGARKTVAVKLLAPNLAAKPQYRDMFLEEAKLSMLLNNSNIVQVFDAGEEGGECYMAMEWIDGANLSELQAALWENGRTLPVGVAMYVAGEVLRALDYAHNLQFGEASTIVHRDVSPANIMLSMAGEVKLTDFGVARFGTEETSGLHVKGKLRYMPPEQLRGNSKQGTVDIFSVGAVLHEMLDGDKFRGSNKEESELLSMIFDGVIPELGDPTRVSPALDELRRRMIAAEVSDRIPSAREALRLLCECPGYRHASHELEALVRWYRGLEPGDLGHRPGRYSESLPPIPGTQSRDTSISRFGSPASGGWAQKQVLGRVPLMIAAAFVGFCGLGVGCVGVGLAVNNLQLETASDAPDKDKSWEGQDWEGLLAKSEELGGAAAARELGGDEPSEVEQGPAEAQTPEAQTPELQAPGAQTPETGAEPEQALDPGSEPEPASGLEGELVLEDPDSAEAPEEAQPEVEPAPKPKPKPRAKVKHDPVEVTFAANDFGFAYLKVGGKRLVIEPFKTVKLRPGTHRVYARFGPDEKWTYFGKAKIAPDKSHTVKLVKPKGLKVSP